FHAFVVRVRLGSKVFGSALAQHSTPVLTLGVFTQLRAEKELPLALRPARRRPEPKESCRAACRARLPQGSAGGDPVRRSNATDALGASSRDEVVTAVGIEPTT